MVFSVLILLRIVRPINAVLQNTISYVLYPITAICRKTEGLLGIETQIRNHAKPSDQQPLKRIFLLSNTISAKQNTRHPMQLLYFVFVLQLATQIHFVFIAPFSLLSCHFAWLHSILFDIIALQFSFALFFFVAFSNIQMNQAHPSNIQLFKGDST